VSAVKDPICGKEVDPLRARAVGIFGGVTYYFCSAECKSRFKDPRARPRETAAAPSPEAPSPSPPPSLSDLASAPTREPTPARAREPTPDAPLAGSEPEPSPMVDETPAAKGGRLWLVALVLAALAGLALLAVR
jgi:Cu+-exporting ATPase